MRTITLLLSALVLGTTANAQTAATFDDLTLPTTDTYYVNYTNLGGDVGFADGKAFFPCLYGISFGDTVWNYFAYSNKTDSVTSGINNQYAAKTGTGYGGSAKYAVAYCASPVVYTDYSVNVKLTGTAVGKPVVGFYVTNSTYTYNSMRDGDAFAKKFGGVTGNDPDFFMLTVKGYRSGSLTPDSVNFYLADFRFTDNDSDYLVKTWEWVNLSPLGHIDSLQFRLSSSDTGFGYINTPTYFCIDNFTTNETSLGVNNELSSYAARVYPNPVASTLNLDIADNAMQQIAVVDMAGKVISTHRITTQHIEINISTLPAGTYMLQMTGGGKTATTKFVKQ